MYFPFLVLLSPFLLFHGQFFGAGCKSKSAEGKWVRAGSGLLAGIPAAGWVDPHPQGRVESWPPYVMADWGSKEPQIEGRCVYLPCSFNPPSTLLVTCYLLLVTYNPNFAIRFRGSLKVLRRGQLPRQVNPPI